MTTCGHKLEWESVSKALLDQHPRTLSATSHKEQHHQDHKQHAKGGRWRKSGYYASEEPATAPALAYVAAEVPQDPQDAWEEEDWQEEEPDWAEEEPEDDAEAEELLGDVIEAFFSAGIDISSCDQIDVDIIVAAAELELQGLFARRTAESRETLPKGSEGHQRQRQGQLVS